MDDGYIRFIRAVPQIEITRDRIDFKTYTIILKISIILAFLQSKQEIFCNIFNVSFGIDMIFPIRVKSERDISHHSK